MDCLDSLKRRKGLRRVSVISLIRSAYLSYFAKPAADRTLWRAIQRRPIRAIVEIGIGLGDVSGFRTERLLEVAGWRRDCLPLAYTGIDLFESRPAGQSRLTLKDAFGTLRATGAKTRLVPGDPASALARTANALTGTDLLLIAAVVDRQSLLQAWRFVPRMMHPATLVLVQEIAASGEPAAWRTISHDEAHRLAAEATRALRRAA
jgi:hypothetical protein